MSTSKNSTDGSQTFLRWFRVLVLAGALGWLAFVVYQNTFNIESPHAFRLGLDLAGGSHLVYEADTSGANPAEIPELMNVLRDVIERRVNIFGVSEPIVQVEHSSFVSDEPSERLVVELPGVTDVSQAVEEIGKTPLLEFKLLDASKVSADNPLSSLESLAEVSSSTGTSTNAAAADPFVDTGLSGRYLQSASMEFAGGNGGQLSNEPLVRVNFNDEGSQLFAQITRDHVGEQLGIFLDGELLSAPVINEAIVGGTAIISGNFTLDEAKALAQNLSFGALPLPIALESTQTVGATLGGEVLQKGVQAGFIGLAIVIGFMMFWYRLPGLIAGVALVSYIVIMLALFQYIPVTITAAGLAGFILSLGMAVDANVLVFERMKEEFQAGRSSREAARIGFNRAWSAIRDGNVTSLLSAIILFWFGTSLVKGFALVFGLGVAISMFSALVVTRTLLVALPDVKKQDGSLLATLLGNGLKK